VTTSVTLGDDEPAIGAHALIAQSPAISRGRVA
jgi:hypothetical protein